MDTPCSSFPAQRRIASDLSTAQRARKEHKDLVTKSSRRFHGAYIGVICLTLMSCSAAASATDTGAEQTETAHFLTVPAMNSPTLTPTLVHTLNPAQAPTTTSILTEAPTSTSTLTATPMPTRTVGIYALQPTDPESIAWKVYRNEEYSFEFEYPTLYDEYELEERKPCELLETIDVPNYPIDEIKVGSRTFLSFSPEEEDLETYIVQLIERKEWHLSSKQTHIVAGVEAVSIEFEFGGMGRRGWATFFKRGDTLYSISYSLSGGSTCDFGQMGFGEIEIYAHMVTSFRFLH